LVSTIQTILDQDLRELDIYFSEQEALILAAGTYFSGYKQIKPDSTLIPKIIQKIWKQHDELQQQFPNINDLTNIDNILIWAKKQGREQYPEIAFLLDHLEPFKKKGQNYPWDRSTIQNLGLEEALFGAIGFDPKLSMAANAEIAESRHRWPITIAQKVNNFLRGKPSQ
jgi:hypothetical protein